LTCAFIFLFTGLLCIFASISQTTGRLRRKLCLVGFKFYSLTPTVIHCTLGPRTFSVAGPSLWNSLPDSLRDLDLGRDGFRRLLKDYMTVRPMPLKSK